MQIYAPAADPSILLATAATLGITVGWLKRDCEAEPGRVVLLPFQPLDLRLAESTLPTTAEELCQGYQHLLESAADPAAFGGQRRLVVNLSTCSLPKLLREAQTCGQTPPRSGQVFTRPTMDPLAAMVALRLEQHCPGTLDACERLDQLAGGQAQAGVYRQQLEQATGTDSLLDGWCRRQKQESQLQAQGQELDARWLELGSLPVAHERLLRQMESQTQALTHCTDIANQRDQWQEHCRELEVTLDSLQRQLEHEAQLGRQRALLTERWAEASRELQRIQLRWLNS